MIDQHLYSIQLIYHFQLINYITMSLSDFEYISKKMSLLHIKFNFEHIKESYKNKHNLHF